jgi:hypothetical protein
MLKEWCALNHFGLDELLCHWSYVPLISIPLQSFRMLEEL